MSAVHQYTSSSRRSKTNCVDRYAPTMYPAVVCTIPLGLPVEPDVYKRKRRSSLSIGWGSHSYEHWCPISWCQTSRGGCHAIEFFARCTTSTVWIASIPAQA